MADFSGFSLSPPAFGQTHKERQFPVSPETNRHTHTHTYIYIDFPKKQTWPFFNVLYKRIKYEPEVITGHWLYLKLKKKEHLDSKQQHRSTYTVKSN